MLPELVFHTFTAGDSLPSELSIEMLTEFIYKELGVYSDSPAAIRKALEHALSSEPQQGGRLIIATTDAMLCAALLILDTHMELFVPEHLIVYLSVAEKYRNMGIGKQMLDLAKESCKGSFALHVEADNPARKLYTREGFSSPYVEMRWWRD